MPFYCPHQDGTTEICHRLGGMACRVGQPGCALFGKVARLEDEPPMPAKTRRARKKTGSDGTEAKK